MRFGSHSHIEPEKVDSTVKGERDRLVALLRGLADKIEAAPVTRVSEALTWMANTAETLAAMVERALSGKK
jgi:hypothetical protein